MQHGDIFANFQLRRPGSYHHARFMGKSLYPLKIFLLGHIFPLSRRENENLIRIAEYIILLYTRYFLSSRLRTAALRLDLSFWYDFQSYRALLPAIFQRKIVDSAWESVKRYLWYLCPEMVVLGLFDDGLSEWEKERMASELQQTPRPDVFQTEKPGQPHFQPIAAHLTPERPPLAMFISKLSWLAFHSLDVDMAHMHWLTLPPSTWDQFATYTHLRSFLQDMQVVNDAAELVVKDVQEYGHMNRATGDRDNVILVATEHRGCVANLYKPNLNRVLSEFTWMMQLEIWF